MTTTYEAPTAGLWDIRASAPPQPGALIGFDSGLSTGWAVLDRDRFYAGGAIDIRQEAQPFAALARQVRELVRAFKPRGAVMEQGFLPPGASSAQSHQLRGAIKTALEEEGVPMDELHPMTARARIGRARATDAERRKVLCAYFGMPEKFRLGGSGRAMVLPCHVVDAAAVAWAYGMGEK
jgi:Holliday junction resolvasome RuvABC endonuclease subunit